MCSVLLFLGIFALLALPFGMSHDCHDQPEETGTRPVLVTTAMIVHVPKDRLEDDGFTYVEPYEERLAQAIKDAFRQIPEVEYPGSSEIRPIWIEDTNIGRCEQCGAWISDYTRPECLPGLIAGRQIDGRWVCDECENFGTGSSGSPAVTSP